MLVSMQGGDTLSVGIMDMSGTMVHSWQIDWFDIWPDPEHLSEIKRPKSRPGTHIHGAQLFPNGDLVFNFEKLGMVRMGLCGEVQWKLPYRTHHSIEFDDDGNLWVAAQRDHPAGLANYPNHLAPVSESMALLISPEGAILREISLFEVLDRNDMRGYLYMPGGEVSNVVTADAMHVNDIQPMPAALAYGDIEAGDLMVSMRNVSTVFIFDPDTLAVKFVRSGNFVRQHDPDFMDDGWISVYDNNWIGPDNYGQQSRIVAMSLDSQDNKVVYEGTSEAPFYSKIMGKTQWLDNGNLLIVESIKGRAFELNPAGEIVWEFFNIIDDGKAGIVQEVKRLPASFNEIYSQASCE